MWLPGEQTPSGGKQRPPFMPPGGDRLNSIPSSRGQGRASASREVDRLPGHSSDSRDPHTAHLTSPIDSSPRDASQSSADGVNLSQDRRDSHFSSQPVFPEDLSQVGNSGPSQVSAHLATSQLETSHLANSQLGAAHLASSQLGATQMYLQGLSNSGGHFNMDTAVPHPYWLLNKHDGQIF